MSRNKTPVTAATRESRGRKIDFSDHAYNYEEHGDLKVSTKELARKIGVRAISPCNPETANRLSPYVICGTSLFETRKKMPVYIEKTILCLEKIYKNGGKRGYLIGISPRDVVRVVDPKLVGVGIRNA